MKTLGVLAGAAGLLAAPAAVAQPERDWSGIERCAAIGDAVERHSCLDGELAALGLLERGPASASVPAVPGPQVQALEAAPPPASGRTGETITYQPNEPRDPAIADMVSTVASARLDARGLEVEAANGTRWRSTSSVSLRRAPRSGAAFAVAQGALGSYNCRIESSTYFKCERLS